jgi:hypothetical protein
METLKGQNIINRMSELMNYGSSKAPAKSGNKKSFNNLEYSITLNDGKTLGILRENAKFYIKETTTKNPTVNDFEFIGGIINGAKQSYSSYSDAIKFLNLMISDSNSKNPFAKQVNLYENCGKKHDLEEKKDVEPEKEEDKKKDDKELDEEGKVDEKTVLKLPKNEPQPQPQPAPAAPQSQAPSLDKTSDDSGIDGGLDLGDDKGGDDSLDSLDLGDDKGGDDLGLDDLGSEGGSDEQTKQIQKLTGKLGQKMRDLEQPNEDLTKYVFNSVTSSLDLKGLDDQNKKEIVKKFKKKLKGEEEEEENGKSDEFSSEETPDTGLEDTGLGLDNNTDGKDEELAENNVAPFGEKTEPRNIKTKNAPFTEKPTKLKTENRIKRTIEKYFDEPVIKETVTNKIDLLTEGKKKCKTALQEASLKKVIDFDKNFSIQSLKENIILKTNHVIVVGNKKHQKYVMIETTGKIKGILMDTTTKKGIVYRMNDKNDYLNFIKLGKTK